MATSLVEPERIRSLNDRPIGADRRGSYVLYWMQASMRAEHNPALEHAVQVANDLTLPLVVATTIIGDYPDASPRHFAFMLGGMGHALRAAHRRGAAVCVRVGDPVDCITDLGGNAALVICDRGYLRHQRAWRRRLAESLTVQVDEVEGDSVVPVDVASDKQETAARTLRPKLHRVWDDYIVELSTTALDITDHAQLPDLHSDVELDEFGDVDSLLDDLGLSGDGPQPIRWLRPGTSAARARLDDLLDRLDDYPDDRNRYLAAETSLLSPYLHFGQISPVAIAVAVREHGGTGASELLEELVVRRELALNYVTHCDDYDRWAGLPEWARTSLEAHADDSRHSVYTADELERGDTDDDVWNAIMDEIRERGWVHNQLRMYWGKQIIGWTNTPQHAHRTLLELNNRWFLDGRDPSSYSNVGWCFGLHDQGFAERAVIGKVRPFTDAALRRKDDLRAWLVTHGR